MSLGDYMQNTLRKLRKENNLTQVALQMQTGIEQAILSKFENGECIPPTESSINFWFVSSTENIVDTHIIKICQNNK